VRAFVRARARAGGGGGTVAFRRRGSERREGTVAQACTDF
jgi:hypothetical protein